MLALFDVISPRTLALAVSGLALVTGVLVSWWLSRVDVVLHSVETRTEKTSSLFFEEDQEESAADIVARLAKEGQ